MIKGTYYSGESSLSHPAVLRVTEDGSVHIDGVSITACPVTELDISPRVGNTARLIRLPNGASFQTNRNDEVDALTQQWLPSNHWFSAYNWETKLKYIAASVLLTVGLVVGLVKWGIPFAAKQVAFALPPEFSVVLADGALSQMDDVYFEPSELAPERKKALTQLFQQHLPDNSDFSYQLLFRKSPVIGANAFALPDGSVVLTDELVTLTDNDEEILSVLLHEMGHVELRHAMRGTIQASGLYAIYSWITGDLAATSSLIAMLPVVLTQTGYSRQLEWEADGYSLEVMHAQEIDPIRFAHMMTKLEQSHKKDEADNAAEQNDEKQSPPDTEEDDSLLSYFSTHPPSAKRVERFTQASQAWHLQHP